MGVTKKRIDTLLVDQKKAKDTNIARLMVMAGEIRMDGQVIINPSALVDPAGVLTVESRPRYVSRGGDKLEAALQAFDVKITGRCCADVGASTGGFTDCLLQFGAARIYSIDVGHGILDWKLRQDARVIVMEDTNARYVKQLPEPVSLVTIDASFISLKILLPIIKTWISSTGEVLALIKPQFEADRKEVARTKGVLRDPEVHQKILLDMLAFTQQEGYEARAIIRSPLLGPKGNAEFFAHLIFPATLFQDIGGLVARLLNPAGEIL